MPGQRRQLRRFASPCRQDFTRPVLLSKLRSAPPAGLIIFVIIFIVIRSGHGGTLAGVVLSSVINSGGRSSGGGFGGGGFSGGGGSSGGGGASGGW